MSCSVRKKGPKWVSKYSFSRRAWLLGADQSSTGLVVTWTNTRPEEQAAMKAREKKMTQPGYRTQKEPHCVKSRLKQPSNAAPSGSQQGASPGRAGEEERVEVKSRVIPESWNKKSISFFSTRQGSCLLWGHARGSPLLSPQLPACLGSHPSCLATMVAIPTPHRTDAHTSL